MDPNSIRIASYNIRKARGLDQHRKPERILQVINTLDADIIALQEADRRLGARPTALPRAMIEAETDFNVIEYDGMGDSIGWHGNSVWVRNGIVAHDVDPIPLPGLEPRGALRVQIAQAGKTATPITLVATHLGLLRASRQAQLTALEAATRHDCHVVIAGDFNEWSPRKGLDPINRRFVTHSPGRSFHARRPIAGLDRFALSRGVTLKDAGVQQGALARVASDHLPIWSDISVHP